MALEALNGIKTIQQIAKIESHAAAMVVCVDEVVYSDLKVGSAGIEMESALEFLAVEAGSLGRAVFRRAGAVPVAHVHAA